MNPACPTEFGLRFNPRPRVRGDIFNTTRAGNSNSFQSTPPREGRRLLHISLPRLRQEAMCRELWALAGLRQ